jgi:hypothetical protein
MLVICNYCLIEFNKPASHVKRVKKVYCSTSCYNLSQEVKLEKTCVICGDFFKYRKSEEHKFKTCSKPECRLANKTGNNNPNWRHGKTKERKRDMSCVKYKTWRNAVFQRDNYHCIMCGKKPKMANADHILPWAYFPDKRYDINNGRTLCLECHKKTYKDVFEWRKRLIKTPE